MIIALTGRPGVGKSTVFGRVVQELKSMGINVYGFYCPEVREGNRRSGFKIVDLYTGEEGWLAVALDKIEQYDIKSVDYGKRIGRYVVVARDASYIGVNALKRIYSDPNGVLGIDEIGPMELSIDELRREIIEAIKRSSRALVVIHRNLNDREIIEILRKKNAYTYIVTEVNRNNLHKEVLNRILNYDT